MRIAFFISSVLDLEKTNNLGFTYSSKRTFFSPEERLRQTQFTLNSIDFFFPEAKKFVFDSGYNSEKYRNEILSFQSNTEFISHEEINSDTTEIIRTNSCRGLCESLITHSFFHIKQDELMNYDYIVKISGRYFIKHFNTSSLNEENMGKIVIKNPYIWEWDDNWHYPNKFNKNGFMKYCPTQCYAVGRNKIEQFKNDMKNIAEDYVANPSIQYVDYECQFTYHVVDKNEVFETDIITAGWTGTNGRYTQC